jgi:vitamin B12 transporter
MTRRSRGRIAIRSDECRHRSGAPRGAWPWLAVAGALVMPATAAAQTTLPGIVVEGATLTPPRRPSTGQPATQPANRPAAEPAGSAPVAEGPGTSGGPTADAGAGQGDAAGSDGQGSTVGSSVTVVTGDDLRRQQVRHAGEYLRGLPGVTVSRGGGFAAQTQVRIRGAEANHTLVLIDGVVANDTNNGAFDFSDLSAEAIERIEVIRGPQSGLYGSNALGGVINIITKSGRGPLQLTARAEGGSFGTFDYAASASGGNSQAWGAVTYHERHSTGFNVSPVGTEKDGSELKTVSAKGGAQIVPGVTLDYSLRYSVKQGDRDTEGGPAGTLAVQVDDPSKFESTVFLGGVNLRWDTLDGKLTHIVRASRNETRTFDASPGFISNNVSETLKYGYLGTWRFDTPSLLASSAVTVLVEDEREAFLPISDFADGIERNRGRLATALEYKTEIGRRLGLTANVRHDDNDLFQDFTTWRTAASLRLSEVGLRPHASIGTGVKLPTMFETFGSIPNFFTPNPNLRPETSRGWDAGVEATLWSGRVILDVTYFEADLQDRINGFVPGPNFTFTATNTPGISRRDGVEVSARIALTSTLTLSGAYTHLTALDADGADEIRRPRHSARADLTWAFSNGRGKAALAAIYNGGMDDTAFRIDGYSFGFPLTHPERTRLGDYWLVNAAASYQLNPGVEVFGRVENLLNERYYEIYGFNTPGIAGFAGVKLTFGGEGSGPLATK